MNISKICIVICVLSLICVVGLIGAIDKEYVKRSDMIVSSITTPQNVSEIKSNIKYTPIISEECVLNDIQKNTLNFSYSYGNKYDLGYTLAAIALKESNAGLWNISIQDPSGSPYHVTLNKVLADKGWESNSFNKNKAMQTLVNDVEYAASLAIKEILFWKERSAGNWMNVWASYNVGGMGKDSSKGTSYANDIRDNIAQIKRCGWDRL